MGAGMSLCSSPEGSEGKGGSASLRQPTTSYRKVRARDFPEIKGLIWKNNLCKYN